jgi:DNA segregation ATPase FtsK/SpoIIIE, S-DNA-T family
MSELLGVAFFASSLLWLIALASYSPSDPAWFFNTGSATAPVNFAGRIGAFISELSYQLFGYAAYLVPLSLSVIGWHYFWCRVLDAVYTKLVGALLLFACLSSFLSLAFGTFEVAGKPFRAGGFVGDLLSTQLGEYLNRTGSIIVILTLLFLAIILSTQFSFGRLFVAVFESVRDRAAGLIGAVRQWREERRRARQRREVLKKHLEKSPASAAAVAGRANVSAPRPP